MRIFTTFIISIFLLLFSPIVNGQIENYTNSPTKPHILWNRTWEKNESAGIVHISTSLNGDIFVAGGTRWSSPESLILKYDFNGNEIWNRTWINGTRSVVWGLCIDNSENIYVTIADDKGDHFNKFNSFGIIQWEKILDGAGTAIAIANDSIFGVGGNINGDAAISRYDLNGTIVWNKTWDSGEYDTLNGIAISPNNGIIYATGITGPKSGPMNVLTIAYDPNGKFLWNRTWGGSAEDSGTGIAVDSDNNVYVCGWTESYSKGIDDVLLLKYNSSGDLQWYRTWGTMETDQGNGIEINNNDIFIVGLSDSNALLLKYNISGNEIWNTTWNGTRTQGFWGVTVNNLGEIYAAGILSYTGSLPFHIFIVKYIEVVVPEFITTILPIATVIALFIIVTKIKKKKRDLYERNY